MTVSHQAYIHGPYDLRIDQVNLDDRPLGSNELLVQTQVTALSTGTDMGNYTGDGTYVPGSPGYPRSVGYSNVGIVAELGPGVAAFRIGERVFTTKRHASLCRTCMTDLIVRVPETVSSEEASLSYFAQLGVSALRQAGYQPGETVAVVGLGVIGLCTVAVARALGARVIALGNADTRLNAAGQVGAHHALSSADPEMLRVVQDACSGELPDIVILTANTWEAYRTSMEIVRFAGRVAILGFPGRHEGIPEFNPLSPRWLWAKRLSIFGCGFEKHTDSPVWERRFTTRRNLKCILDLLSDRSLYLAPLITHRLPFEQMRVGYELAAAHSKELIAAVFYWNQESKVISEDVPDSAPRPNVAVLTSKVL